MTTDKQEPQSAEEDPRTRDAVYVVEASSYERHSLWREHSAHPTALQYGGQQSQRMQWEQLSPGWGPFMGTLAGFSVVISIQYVRIHGSLVIFWYPASRVVDYALCEAWLTANVPCYKSHHTNADNFGQCLNHIRTIATAESDKK